MTPEVGLVGRAETVVVMENTAAAVGSGLLPVFATPMMVALMEHAAVNALEGHLDAGQGTVGIGLELSHDAATPIGMKVWAEARLTAVEGRALTFSVNAFDEAGPIGRCTHRRFLIHNDKFLAKIQAKNG